MDLKKLSEIANLSDDELQDYAVQLSVEQGYGVEQLVTAFKTLRLFNVCSPEEVYASRYTPAYIFRKARQILSEGGEVNLIDFEGVIKNFTLSVGSLCLVPLLIGNRTVYAVMPLSYLEALEESIDNGWTTIFGLDMDDWNWFEDMSFNTYNQHQRRIAQYLDFLGIRSMTEGERNIIPPNSASLGIDESTTRFSSALWFNEIQNKVITLAGIGGIGSYVALLLARMKPKALFLYDDDVVETVNMAGQLYSINDVGKKKVNALADICSSFALYDSVFAIPEKYTIASEPSDIMICGFDNMAARNLFFHKWVSHVRTLSEEHRKHCLFLDGRLAAEEFQVFCITGDDAYNISLYERKYLFDDSQADATVCSYKQTSYMANMIGSMIVNLFVNFVANEVTEGIRDLPFLTTYEGESLMFNTEQ